MSLWHAFEESLTCEVLYFKRQIGGWVFDFRQIHL